MDKDVRDLIDMINQRIKELNSIYHAAASKVGISDGEAHVWSVLLNGDKLYSQQELCDLLYLPKQTINSIISNMVKKEFVILKPILGTRNKKNVCLTEKGLEYGRNKVMWIFQAEEKALEGTDIQEAKICISMLEKYIASFKKELNKK